LLNVSRTKIALSLRAITKYGGITAPALCTLSASVFAADGGTLTQLPLSRVLADEQEIIAQQPESYQLVMESIQTRDNDTVEAISPNNVNNPENVKRIETILSEEDWNYLFAERDPAYTYLNFLKAAGKYPALCGSTLAEAIPTARIKAILAVGLSSSVTTITMVRFRSRFMAM